MVDSLNGTDNLGFDDRFKTLKEIVEENGYIYTNYTVTTEDGY